MKTICIVLLIALIQGCSLDCRPCREKRNIDPKIKESFNRSVDGSGFHGYQYWQASGDGLIPHSHCAPCSSAVTIEEKLVCSGYLTEKP